MYRIVYISKASRTITDNDLNGILTSARANNQRLNISGLLLFVGDTFFQVLEGPQNAVEEVYDRVFYDDRHCRIRIMQQRSVAARRFPDWSMGFKTLSQSEPISASFFELSRNAFVNRIPSDAAGDLMRLMVGFAETKLAN